MQICSIVFNNKDTLLAQTENENKSLAFIITLRDNVMLFNETCSGLPLKFNESTGQFSFDEGREVYGARMPTDDIPVYGTEKIEVLYPNKERHIVYLYFRPQGMYGRMRGALKSYW